MWRKKWNPGNNSVFYLFWEYVKFKMPRAKGLSDSMKNRLTLLREHKGGEIPGYRSVKHLSRGLNTFFYKIWISHRISFHQRAVLNLSERNWIYYCFLSSCIASKLQKLLFIEYASEKKRCKKSAWTTKIFLKLSR